MNLEPSFWSLAEWPYDPTEIIAIVIPAVLYWLGVRYMRAHGLGRRLVWWRQASFALAIVVAFIALCSPIDDWANSYLWAHMLQHELLAFVIAPLLLLGDPLLIIWRGVPLGGRRVIGRWFVQSGWLKRFFEAAERFLRLPAVSFLTFVVLYSVWHLPALYDLAEANDAVHAFEHFCFVFGGLIFWSQFIPSFPFKPNIGYVWQSAYFMLAMAWGFVLGWPFLLSTTPSYPYYADLARTPGMLDAITDQHIAGAIMDAFDTAIFISCAIIAVAFWLRDIERKSEAEEREYQLQSQSVSTSATP